MSLGLFDLLGPIMMGPSSSHTAGAARIGYMAHLIVGNRPLRITLGFHEAFMMTYAGHRTHAALIAGLKGYREDDPQGAGALKELKDEGVKIEVISMGENVHRNSMQLEVETRDGNFTVRGKSVGGGAIVIDQIDHVPVYINGNNWAILCYSREDMSTPLQEALAKYDIVDFFTGKTGDTYLSCCITNLVPSTKILYDIQKSSEVTDIKTIPPLYKFRSKAGKEPWFFNFNELLARTRENNSTIAEVAAIYESKRTDKTQNDIFIEAEKHLEVMGESIEKGLAGEEKLLGGFCTGKDAYYMEQAVRAKKVISGDTLPRAIAKSMAVVEVNAAMGRIAAAPTAGAAGVIPGVIFTLSESQHKSKDELIQSLLVAGAIGVCIANRASLSGAVGGCQGEIGIAAAMAAGSAVFLAGETPEKSIEASALSLKNLLGLICDPPVGPVEIPCIKRNGMGVAAAFMGAEMSLAGIKSTIPPDEVVDALCNTQKHLPQILKGSGHGGLGCTKTSEKMKREWEYKLKKMD